MLIAFLVLLCLDTPVLKVFILQKSANTRNQLPPSRRELVVEHLPAHQHLPDWTESTQASMPVFFFCFHFCLFYFILFYFIVLQRYSWIVFYFPSPEGIFLLLLEREGGKEGEKETSM